ncbi:MAG: hypothetical protein OEZ06_05905 [Myxococcales bacterium]|nr:hypothetical protein [Myxococcales bacterium]
MSAVAAPASAQSGAVLDVGFIPAPRAQIAIWLEDEAGNFITTIGLTEAVAYRGVGNRPGASEMNSGYRWPYGRREGVLPIWGRRRAGAVGAAPFKRVIFQDRSSEGFASRTSTDFSPDTYFCLSFDRDTTSRDALDAVSCASVFTSDKGRYVGAADVESGYSEPYQDPRMDSSWMAQLGLESWYPPRMDLAPCGGCSNDHADVASFAQHAREAMPEIDAVTMATPPGGVEQSVLFTVPTNWPAGRYALLAEVNVEGDYNGSFDASVYPTPSLPSGKWDSWAMTYGYPYRGQPSALYKVSFELGGAGSSSHAAAAPVGRASWHVWDEDYGRVHSPSDLSDDPSGAPFSGADRLRAGQGGGRLRLQVTTFTAFAPSDEPPPWMQEAPTPVDRAVEPRSGDTPGSDPGQEPAMEGDTAAEASGGQTSTGSTGAGSRDGAMEPAAEEEPLRDRQGEDGDEAVILTSAEARLDGPIGPVRGLQIEQHQDGLHSHEWIVLRFRAVKSERPLHRYEVRVSQAPIEDEASFIRDGRPAKTATEDAEGAVSLMLPVDVAAGEAIETEIGDLAALTHYHVAVRARDILNRSGPISVAQVTTTERTFATVSPCVIASAAWGTPLAREVGILRGVRDRYLMPHAPGRALVGAYYAHAPPLAQAIDARPWLRSLMRGTLRPVIALARLLL